MYVSRFSIRGGVIWVCLVFTKLNKLIATSVSNDTKSNRQEYIDGR